MQDWCGEFDSRPLHVAHVCGIIEPMDGAFSDVVWFKPYMAVSTSGFRKRLVRHGLLEESCNSCGIREWMGSPAPLQLDHIDGNRLNNVLQNLQLLCPNCHALTPTFGGKNKASATISVEQLCRAYDKYVAEKGCIPSANKLYIYMGKAGGVRGVTTSDRIKNLLGEERPVASRTSRAGSGKTKIEWPSDDDLLSMLTQYPRTRVAEMLGVSDTAVKKRCASRGVVEPSTWRRVKSTKAAPLTPAQKAQARLDRSKKRLKKIHGTRAGYLLEVRLGVGTCPRCRAANVVYTQSLRNSDT